MRWCSNKQAKVLSSTSLIIAFFSSESIVVMAPISCRSFSKKGFALHRRSLALNKAFTLPFLNLYFVTRPMKKEAQKINSIYPAFWSCYLQCGKYISCFCGLCGPNKVAHQGTEKTGFVLSLSLSLSCHCQCILCMFGCTKDDSNTVNCSNPTLLCKCRLFRSKDSNKCQVHQAAIQFSYLPLELAS